MESSRSALFPLRLSKPVVSSQNEARLQSRDGNTHLYVSEILHGYKNMDIIIIIKPNASFQPPDDHNPPLSNDPSIHLEPSSVDLLMIINHEI